MTSPLENSPANVSTVESVTWPAGSITQTARGGVSLPASSSSVVAVSAPCAAAAASASALRSKATTSCPPFSRRSVMLAPILPSPIMPIFIRAPLERGRCRSERSGLVGQRLEQLVEGLGERRHALVLERLLHVLHVDTGRADGGEGGHRRLRVGIDRAVQGSVILER